jgi:hypothetical protein
MITPEYGGMLLFMRFSALKRDAPVEFACQGISVYYERAFFPSVWRAAEYAAFSAYCSQ